MFKKIGDWLGRHWALVCNKCPECGSNLHIKSKTVLFGRIYEIDKRCSKGHYFDSAVYII